jgi:hypothetical protein
VHDLRHTAEAQVADMKRTVDEVRQHAQQQLEALRRGTQEELDQVRRLAEAEIVNARRSANADAEELVVSQLAAAAADNDLRTREAVDQAVALADAAALAGARRLAEAIESLDRARTLGESLDYLAQCAGREVERAAVFVCNGRLQGWRLVGFAPGMPSAKSIDLDFASAGIAGAAAETITPAVRRAASQDLPPFARDAGERDACALPVIVGGAVVAVLYADARAEASSVPDRWQAVLEIRARHVSRSLEAMTVGQAAGLFLPRPMARASQPSRATTGGGMQ